MAGWLRRGLISEVADKSEDNLFANKLAARVARCHGYQQGASQVAEKL